MIDSRKDDVFTCVSSGFCQCSSSSFLSPSSPSALVIITLKFHNKKNRFRICTCTFPCIIYCHKNVNCSIFLKGGSPPFSKNRENPEKTDFFYFSVWNSYWQLRFAKKWTRFGQFGPLQTLESRAPFAICTPNIKTLPVAGVLIEFVLLKKDVKLLKCCCWKRTVMQVDKISRCQL